MTFNREDAKALAERWHPRFEILQPDGIEYARYRFRSLAEFTKEIKLYGHRAESDANRDGDRNSWVYGSLDNRETFLDHVEKGLLTTKLKNKIQKLEKALKPTVLKFKTKMVSIKPKRKRTMYGGASCNMTKLMQGDPYCFSKIKKAGRSKTVRLGISPVANAGQDEEKFLETCAMALATAKIVESLGYSCEIQMVSVSRRRDDKKFVTITLPLKQAGETLDIQKICAVGYSGICRDFIFIAKDAMTYGEDVDNISLHDGYGQSMVHEDVEKHLGLDKLFHSEGDTNPEVEIGGVLQTL